MENHYSGLKSISKLFLYDIKSATGPLPLRLGVTGPHTNIKLKAILFTHEVEGLLGGAARCDIPQIHSKKDLN